MKYKERCECCDTWSDDYDTSTGKIICKNCMKKYDGKVELDMPVQTSIFDFIEISNESEVMK